MLEGFFLFLGYPMSSHLSTTETGLLWKTARIFHFISNAANPHSCLMITLCWGGNNQLCYRGHVGKGRNKDCTTCTFTASDSPNDLRMGFKLLEDWKKRACVSYSSDELGFLQTGFERCVPHMCLSLLSVCYCKGVMCYLLQSFCCWSVGPMGVSTLYQFLAQDHLWLWQWVQLCVWTSDFMSCETSPVVEDLWSTVSNYKGQCFCVWIFHLRFGLFVFLRFSFYFWCSTTESTRCPW